MRMPIVSIIIVDYNSKKELSSCVKSIINSKTEKFYEIIVVDNNGKKSVKNLLRKFPHIIYIPNKNFGYGTGCNLGAKFAKGKYLFFLNPDTELWSDAIDQLYEFLENNKKAGIVAPLLVDPKNKIYPLQGTEALTPIKAIVALSFINKFFPRNIISKKYWLLDWDKKKIKEVAAVPGTAFMIQKSIFEEISGFDEHFFLYFEEFDLCKRVNALGYKIYINPHAIIMHHWGVSTKSFKNKENIFRESRFYYFKKHFGSLSALLVEIFLNIHKSHLFFLCILSVGTFLRFYKLSSSMRFIGDQGWFYLSARNMLLYHKIPLVGITASHTWLHQGSLWTYLLAFAMMVSNFNPVSGAYLTAIIGVGGIILIYKTGSILFSEKTGLFASVLYATSPLVVINDRFAYHTSLIPFFTLLFILSIYKWTVSEKRLWFGFSLFLLSVLYNFELATFLLWGVLGAILLYEVIKKSSWVKFTKRELIVSFFSFIFPLIPFIIYDLHHKFPQTIKFILWILYREAVFFGFRPVHPAATHNSLTDLFSFLIIANSKLVVYGYPILASIIMITSIFILFFKLNSKKNKHSRSANIISVIFAVCFIGFLSNKTVSDAYLPLFFPIVILIISAVFSFLAKNFITNFLTCFIVIIIVFVNIMAVFSIIHKDNLYYELRLNAMKKIIAVADGRKYNLTGHGPGSQFESFTMNSEYLLWWMGNEPVKYPARLKFSISEKENQVNVSKINNGL